MILCCGEALIDMIPTETAGPRPGFVPHSGGAIFNTAIALGRLGAQAGFLTGLSTDLFGEQLADDLRAKLSDHDINAIFEIGLHQFITDFIRDNNALALQIELDYRFSG